MYQYQAFWRNHPHSKLEVPLRQKYFESPDRKYHHHLHKRCYVRSFVKKLCMNVILLTNESRFSWLKVLGQLINRSQFDLLSSLASTTYIILPDSSCTYTNIKDEVSSYFHSYVPSMTAFSFKVGILVLIALVRAKIIETCDGTSGEYS